MKAIPVPVRERIVRLYEEGRGTEEIAAFCGHCVAAVRRVRQQFKERGTLEPQTRRCGRKTLLTAARLARLKQTGPTPPWPSWEREWTARSEPRPWTDGCAGWA